MVTRAGAAVTARVGINGNTWLELIARATFETRDYIGAQTIFKPDERYLFTGEEVRLGGDPRLLYFVHLPRPAPPWRLAWAATRINHGLSRTLEHEFPGREREREKEGSGLEYQGRITSANKKEEERTN